MLVLGGPQSGALATRVVAKGAPGTEQINCARKCLTTLALRFGASAVPARALAKC
jgi:hypothetical protein